MTEMAKALSKEMEKNEQLEKQNKELQDKNNNLRLFAKLFLEVYNAIGREEFKTLMGDLNKSELAAIIDKVVWGD